MWRLCFERFSNEEIFSGKETSDGYFVAILFQFHTIVVTFDSSFSSAAWKIRRRRTERKDLRFEAIATTYCGGECDCKDCESDYNKLDDEKILKPETF